MTKRLATSQEQMEHFENQLNILIKLLEKNLNEQSLTIDKKSSIIEELRIELQKTNENVKLLKIQQNGKNEITNCLTNYWAFNSNMSD